mgnify:CR=1 FL=1|jgi:glycosyltransferase involved in cell wall biosynthesis
MTKKRVLIIYRSFFPSLSHLGPATAIRNLIDNLSGDYSIHLLTLNYDFATGRPLFEGPVHRETVGSTVLEYIPKGWAGWSLLFRRLKENFDVIDIHCGFDPLLAVPTLVLCRLGLCRGSRVFHTPHGIFMDVIMSTGALKKWLFCRMTDLLGLYREVVHLAGSSAEARDIRCRHIRTQDVRTVSQFVELVPVDRVERKKLPNQLRIALIGRVTLQKNVQFALDVVRRLSVESSLDIFGEVGDDPYARKCIEMARTRSGKCEVTFKGNVSKQELFRQLSEYDILLHPTLGENFGHAIVEALALGIPVLISDKSPWTDVSESNAGWSLPLSESEAFVEKLRLVHAMGAEDWSAMSRGALCYSRENFDNRRTAERYHDAYG